MTEDLARQLGDTALCQGLTRQELQRIAEAGRVEFWPAGSVVMEEGSIGPRVVVLLEGKVEICKSDAEGKERVLATVGPGGILGEMGLLRDQARSATVRAIDPLRLFAMDRGTFQEMVEEGDPAALKVGLAIAVVLANRVTELNRKVVELLEHAQGDRPLEEFSEYRQRLFTRWDF